jgi:hypothetical protein
MDENPTHRALEFLGFHHGFGQHALEKLTYLAGAKDDPIVALR